MAARCWIAAASVILLSYAAGEGPALAQPATPFLMGGATTAPGTAAHRAT
jgi:hypothetical protein